MKRALFLLHRLELGGSIITAIELAAAVRDHGWDTVIHASPGPLTDLAEQRGVRVVPGPPGQIGISPRDIRAVRRVCRHERPDLVQAWDWRMIYTAYNSAYLGLGIPLLGTVTAMYVPTIVPPDITVSYVTEEIRATDHRRTGRNFVLPPPINTVEDDSSAVDPGAFIAEHHLGTGNPRIVIVSRLDRLMKLDGILRTIDAVGELGADRPVDLVIAGDGDSADEVRAAADRVNAQLGRSAVRLVGLMPDPRPAYAAADIVVGMGTSAVRAMAFGKPVVVVGEDGFAETFDEHTAEELIAAGFYGYGAWTGPNPGLGAQLERLLQDANGRETLGRFGRDVVTERFAIPPVARVLANAFDEASTAPVRRTPGRVAAAVAHGAVLGAGYQLKSLVPWSVRRRFWFRHEPAVRPPGAVSRS